MKVLFFTVHLLALMVCFSTADSDWEKWSYEKQNERQFELTQQPLRQLPVQFGYTSYTHQPYVPVPYPPKAYVHHHPYFSRVVWQKPYASYMPLLPKIYPWVVVPKNLHPVLSLTPPKPVHVPTTSPSDSPTTPIETTTVPITNTIATTVTPDASSKFVTTEYSTTATLPTSSTPEWKV
ncbi:kappa-casein [Dromiciops gliroides]|uniref:kappa-casein n=1 Tax=Dromiciops gliroides TaxID=33562 RepID=UPI001CC67F6B|nr:kappa-casein [Dromiciops gliroides]